MPLVIELFAPRQADLYLDHGVLEIDREGDQGIALLGDLANHLPDLISVEKELADPERIPVEDVSLLIGADVHAIDEHLPLFLPDEGLLDGTPAHADRLDLRADQGDPGLVFFFYKIIVIRLLVVGDQLRSFFLCHFLFLCSLCTFRDIFL